MDKKDGFPDNIKVTTQRVHDGYNATARQPELQLETTVWGPNEHVALEALRRDPLVRSWSEAGKALAEERRAMDEKRSFLDTTEAEWKAHFEKLDPAQRACAVGYWTGQLRRKPGDLPDEVIGLDLLHDPNLSDVVWKLRARALDKHRETLRSLELASKGPRIFNICPKCRNISIHEALYVDKRDRVTFQRVGVMVSGWPHPPDIALDSMADEGFYVRCGHCNYAWYEPMEHPSE